jgi:hypothetical protein
MNIFDAAPPTTRCEDPRRALAPIETGAIVGLVVVGGPDDVADRIVYLHNLHGHWRQSYRWMGAACHTRRASGASSYLAKRYCPEFGKSLSPDEGQNQAARLVSDDRNRGK